MKKYIIYVIIFLALLLIGIGYVMMSKKTGEPKQSAQTVQDLRSEMSFFVTSSNPGRGADLGGLAGADDYCQSIAAAAGAVNRTWRAYLSAIASDTFPAINARDRIGNGPWKNSSGVIVANNLEELHGNNNLNKQTALDEKGAVVNGRGDTPNMHDILTGSDPRGMVIASDTDTTCSNWTSSDQGSAMLGHHDRLGLADDEASRSWNSSHMSRGCSLNDLRSTGGAGLFYCFALTE